MKMAAECAGEGGRQGGWTKTSNLKSKVYGKEQFLK
jgi:hypothetical protein